MPAISRKKIALGAVHNTSPMRSRRATLFGKAKFMLFLVLMITESHRCAAADSIDKGGSKFDVDSNVVGLRGRESSANVEAIDKTDRRDLQAVVKSIQQERTWKGRNSNGRVYIPYVFHPNAFDDGEISDIIEAMQSLEDRTGCLKFIPQTLEQAHLYFRRQSPLTCTADVGMSNGPVYVNLGVPCMGKGIIIHEVMHALGFEHEQNRPDRETYVDVNYDNLISAFYAHNFFVKNDAVTLNTPYEYASVMHYAVDAFAVDGKNSIEPNSDLITDTSVIGQREDATELDIIKIKLLYQCNTQVRTYSQFEDSPCTEECQCRENDTGCGESDDACHGSLICSSNTCVADPTVPPTPEVPPPSITRHMIWNDKGVDLCLELKNRVTTWGNDVWLNQCESTEEASQLWQLESNGFIKSGLDTSLCLVGFAGDTIAGTTLMIYQCLFSDDRFMWDLNDDGSIRPRNNPDVCIQSVSEDDSVGENLVLGECDSGFLEFNKYDVFLSCNDSTDTFTVIKPDGTIIENRSCAWVTLTNSDNELFRCDFEGATENCPSTCDPSCSSPSFTETMLDAAVDVTNKTNKGDCVDFREGYWYDQTGRNCNWYSESRERCITFGHTGSSFGGKVANEACCFCGGGRSDKEISEPSETEDKIVYIVPQTPCYDFAPWSDSTEDGDGCDWYDETRCALYGNSYLDEYNVGANQACCICDGGQEYPPLSDDPNAEPECSDDPFDWRNDNGDDCKWYEEDDNCADYGDYVGNDGLTANDACCACGGGLDPADKCVDSTEVFDVTKPNGNVINSVSCVWVSKFSFRCDFDGAAENCPSLCYESCMVSSPCGTIGTFDVEKLDGTVVSDITCYWISLQPWRCNFIGATENCPLTCDGACPSCEDTTDIFEVVKPDGTVIPNRDCAWVAAHSFRCSFTGATDNCPATCDTCSLQVYE